MGWLARLLGLERQSTPRAKKPPRLQEPGNLILNSGYTLDVVGEGSYQEALLRIAGGYSRDGHRITIPAVLRPEPENLHDQYAVAVLIDRQKIGYLPAEKAKLFREKVPELKDFRCGAVILGGWRTNQHDSGHFGVKLNVRWPPKLAN